MKKKNIAAVLASIVIIAGCVVSPLVVSEVQNRNVMEKVKVVKREKGTERTVPLTFLEKILLYKNSRHKTEQSSENALSSSFEETDVMKEENKVKEAVEKELMKLYHFGILPTPPTLECLKNIQYHVRTYMNSQYDFVTVLEVTIDNFGREQKGFPDWMQLIIEKETGKIMEMFLVKEDSLIERYEYRCPGEGKGDIKEVVKWLTAQWGDYIEAQIVSAKNISEEIGVFENGSDLVVQYSDGENCVSYQIIIAEKEVSIYIR